MKEMCNEILEQKQITYVPPPTKLVREYATLVCNDLAIQSQNLEGQRDDIINGLERFLVALSVMYANYMNKSTNLPNEIKGNCMSEK